MAASNRCRVSSHSRAPRWGASVAEMSWASTGAKTRDQRWMDGLSVKQNGSRCVVPRAFHFRPASSANIKHKAVSEQRTSGTPKSSGPRQDPASLLDLIFIYRYICTYTIIL